MRLKSLELKGFKSFATETVINFNEEVIGIVGPNGSGKSNIVDAIRWVLGEQKSKELRLEKMTNVIFNGTKNRKKTGMAQVSLTFENTKNLLPTEYQTVTITRILYRTGDSEYRLNGVPCRLKDITSLFLDTGIGSNSYAIIALGMVDDLLSDKDNSRRLMFEQAAGISKYKIRKHETLNKLKSTSDDLDRIEDLLFEIENQLGQLEKQAKRAKKYYNLKEQYKDLHVELAVFKLKNYKNRHKEISSKLEAEMDRYRQIETESLKLEAQLEDNKKSNLDKEKILSEAQRSLNQLISDIRNQESDKNILLQKSEFITQNQIKLTAQIKSAQDRIHQLEEGIGHFGKQITEEKKLETAIEEQLQVAESRLTEIRNSHAALKTELDDFMGEQQVIERSIFELEKKKAIQISQIENLQREDTENKTLIEQRRTEVGSLEAQLKIIDKNREQKKKLLEDLEAEEAKRQTEIVETEQLIEAQRKLIADVNRKLDAQRNEYKLTKSMVENLEGFPESIKFLSKVKDWAKDAPLLSDLIYCKEGYRVAIENYLEPYLSYYVVENMEDAYRAIKLLSDAQKGKANFFILEAFKDYTTPMTLLPNTKRAIDLIETDQPYYNLCSYLLENVLVTDDEDIKTKVNDENLVLLSKSGGFVKRKFSVSGGSVGLFEGKKIGRKKNLEVLEISIRKLEKEEKKFSTEFFNFKTKLEQLKAKIFNETINQERRALNQLDQEKVSLMTRLENFENFLRDINEKKSKAAELKIALEQTNKEIEKELVAKKSAAKQAHHKISNTDSAYRQIAEQLSQASNAFNEKNIEFIRQQNKVATLQRELTLKENLIAETKTSLENDSLALANTEKELAEIDESVKKLEQQLVENYSLRKQKESNLSSAEQNYFKARGNINELEDSLRNLNRNRQDAQSLINGLKDKLTDLKLELTSIGERLKIEFNIAINEVLNKEPAPDLNPEELQQNVDRLKHRLDNYGEVNPMAVEAFDEMKQRFDNISSQRDDIIEAKKSLLETIKEIEETATEHFLSAFEKVRTHFIDVFRTLFTDDDAADLILLDPENPLESKIEIVAKPKGKRPQSINQLSGGEKTLTATALLFALYLFKPAPFCIFDEVDAPLDDANIEKFNRIIRKFSEKSQFVIVTHNKQTMAAVDIIYGVYMQEQGVSHVSAVDFRTLEHSASLETV